MIINKAFIICVLAFLVRTSNALEDLLEQYVKHAKTKENGANRKLNNFVSVRDRRDESDSNEDLSQWTHWEYLDDEKNILLRWQTRHQEILFRVEARTLGYVGIGFSPNGDMEGADITIGWVDDSGKAILLDCHGVSKNQGSLPVKDEHDNYTLMKGIQNDTHTILEFRRALDTCDTEDFVLSGDTVRVIWALHDKDPRHDFDMIYHGENRGSQSLHLFGPPPVTQNEDLMYLRTWDVTLKNFEVRNTMNTIYWCKVFKAPTLQQKHHIIGFEPIIGKNHTKSVHHMLLHECEINGLENTAVWEQYGKEPH
ncbi:Copper type II ascorbate-dependent monooxygenase, N-terminal domain [Popillia japonica]|uniref:Copper type II ascorbate-dependent monooxygenase, N-terminal domain n=1 Tax=Popillia japonica TaxID=7064 RepID=A0AAW1MHS2_POPJA